MTPDALVRWSAVWLHNALVWRKSFRTALLGGFAEPLFYLLALGFGLKNSVGDVEGLSYVSFLTAGILATTAMNAATFEGLYLAYTRMEVLKTWDGMLAAPLSIGDVVMGEVLWMATKSTISTGLLLIVTTILGLTPWWIGVVILPVAFVAGLCFGGMALLVTSLARGYDFFVYYSKLVITPMLLLSGVYFPIASLPDALGFGMSYLPLYHVVEIIRPLMAGRFAPGLLAHLAVPVVYATAATGLSAWWLRRRLL